MTRRFYKYRAAVSPNMGYAFRKARKTLNKSS